MQLVDNRQDLGLILGSVTLCVRRRIWQKTFLFSLKLQVKLHHLLPRLHHQVDGGGSSLFRVTDLCWSCVYTVSRDSSSSDLEKTKVWFFNFAFTNLFTNCLFLNVFLNVWRKSSFSANSHHSTLSKASSLFDYCLLSKQQSALVCCVFLNFLEPNCGLQHQRGCWSADCWYMLELSRTQTEESVSFRNTNHHIPLKFKCLISDSKTFLFFSVQICVICDCAEPQ